MKNTEFALRQQIGDMSRTLKAALNQVRLGNAVRDENTARAHREEAERLLREATEKDRGGFAA